MFKKRLKGLLAMVLAGSIALSALPLTASATIQKIYVGSEDYTEKRSQILAGSCTEEPFNSNRNKDNLWAYYAGTTNSGNCYIGATTGNSLGSTLSDLDGKTKFGGYPDNHDVYLRYSHDVIFFDSVPDLYDTYDSGKKVSITDFSEDAQTDVATIAETLGLVTPLQSVSGWTAYYGYTNEDRQILYRSLNGTSYTISGTPKITQEIIKGLYSGNDSMESFLNDGAVFIVPEISYKTFDIPVFNGLGKPEMDGVNPYTLSVTGGCDDYLGNGQNQYYVGYTKQNGEVVLSDYLVNNQASAWEIIEEFAEKDPNFDVDTLFFLRDVMVQVYKDSTFKGNFTSKDLYPSLAANDTENLPDEYKYIVEADDNSIWLPNISQKFVLGEDLLEVIGTYLDNNPDTNNIILKETTEIMVTGTDPDQNKSTESYEKSPLYVEDTEAEPVQTVPATISDHAAVLAESVAPESGNIYDTSNWQLWGCVFGSGDVAKKPIGHFEKSALESTNGVNSIGVDQLNTLTTVTTVCYPLIYFPQVKIAPSLEVTAPVVGIAPSTGATIKDTIGGYTVTSVSWPLTSEDMFEAGKQYTVDVTLEPDAGLAFTEDTSVMINGKTAATTLTDGILTAKYTFDTPLNSITNADIIIDKPTLNGVPDTTFDKHADAHFTASAATWSPADEKFEAGKEYTVTATLTPDEGYVFTNNTVFKINGETVTPDVNDDGTLTVSYTFAELKANPWLDIENELDDILNGENPTITVPSDNPTIPKSVLEEILKGTKPVTITFEDGISWEILPGGTAPNNGINLSVKKDNSEWATVENHVSGETIKMQISIEHEGDFGFNANLVVDLTQAMQSDEIDPNGTYYANLFYVKDKDNSSIKPEWKGCDTLAKNQNGKWIAKLEFTHASDWLITIDDKDKDPSKNNNNGGSGSSGGSFRPSGSSTTTESSTPMFGGKAMSWGDIVAELKKLPIGSEVTIELNGITNVPFEVINVIGERKLKTTFKFDSVRSWKLNGAEITAPAAADLSIIAINRLKIDSLRGISGYQFTMNDTNIPTGIKIAFKTEYAGQFANLYKVVDGKLTFVTCAKVGADGKVILPGVADQGDYVVMLSELSDVLGDMNNDGVLDQKDASAILKDIVGLEQGKNPLMADFNGDGAIDQKDASAILKSIVGLA